MTEIKPIETHYRNYRFRSRLEARWAVFFDALGLDWKYEVEGFETPYGYYLPDFVVTTFEGVTAVYEIKPQGHTDIDLSHKLLEYISQGAPHPNGETWIKGKYSHSALLIGDPCDFFDIPYKICPRCGLIYEDVAGLPYFDNYVEFFCSPCDWRTDCGGGHPNEISVFGRVFRPHKGGIILDNSDYDNYSNWVINAAKISRMARFEHGETLHVIEKTVFKSPTRKTDNKEEIISKLCDIDILRNIITRAIYGERKFVSRKLQFDINFNEMGDKFNRYFWENKLKHLRTSSLLYGCPDYFPDYHKKKLNELQLHTKCLKPMLKQIPIPRYPIDTSVYIDPDFDYTHEYWDLVVKIRNDNGSYFPKINTGITGLRYKVVVNEIKPEKAYIRYEDDIQSYLETIQVMKSHIKDARCNILLTPDLRFKSQFESQGIMVISPDEVMGDG